MTLAHYTRSTYCKWNDCSNEALPGCPTGAEYCASHIDQAIVQIKLMTDRINASHGGWRRPGRWVPVVLFLIWLAATIYYPTMLLWWVIFVPIAFIGWHFGTGGNQPPKPIV